MNITDEIATKLIEGHHLVNDIYYRANFKEGDKELFISELKGLRNEIECNEAFTYENLFKIMREVERQLNNKE